MYEHIKGFMNKLRLWHAHIQNANLSHFLTLKEMGMRPEKKTEFADQREKKSVTLLDYKRTAISWYLRKQVGVIAYPMY